MEKKKCPVCGRTDKCRCYVPKQEDSESPVADSEKAREFLVGFMNCEFEDKTFEKYIRTELAGDFACELKEAITRLVWQSQ